MLGSRIGGRRSGWQIGAEKNPFRGNELLLPKNWEDLATDDRISETEPAEAET